MPVFLPLALALLAATTTPAAPPPETLRRAEAAFGVLEGRGFSGTYLLTVSADVQAPGEDEQSLEVQEVTIEADGSKRTRLVKALENGKDVTAERLARGEGEQRQEGKGGEHGIELAGLPFADDGAGVRFSRVRHKDGLLIARFESRTTDRARAGEKGDDDFDDENLFDKGEIAWNPATGDPVWVELGAANPPRFVSELSLRFEFARTGAVLHASRIITRTKAGVPLLFRIRVNVDIAVSDLRPSAAAIAEQPRQ